MEVLYLYIPDFKKHFARPQSLEGKKPWTYVDFYCAKEIAEHFEESFAIRSHLVYGAEYDTMLQWLYETEAMSLEDLTVLDGTEMVSRLVQIISLTLQGRLQSGHKKSKQ